MKVFTHGNVCYLAKPKFKDLPSYQDKLIEPVKLADEKKPQVKASKTPVGDGLLRIFGED